MAENRDCWYVSVNTVLTLGLSSMRGIPCLLEQLLDLKGDCAGFVGLYTASHSRAPVSPRSGHFEVFLFLRVIQGMNWVTIDFVKSEFLFYGTNTLHL